MTSKLLAFSAIILMAVTAAASQPTAQSSDAPFSSRTATAASQDRELNAESHVLRGSVHRSAFEFSPERIEFICIQNSYIDSQFNVLIVNDVRGDNEELECKEHADVVLPHDIALVLDSSDVFETAKSRGQVALWLITPIIAKVLRDVQFHSETNEFSVVSRRMVRFDVVAVDLNRDSWAIGQFDKTISKAKYSLAAEKRSSSEIIMDKHGVRHRTESQDENVYFNLTDVHEAGKLVLEPLTDPLALEFVRTSVRSGNYHEYQRFRVAEPRVGALNQWFNVEPSIGEMNSVVRIRCEKDESSGTGFYVEDSLLVNEGVNGASTKSESSLVLTNYHVVKCASEGRVVLSNLELEFREKISNSSYGRRILESIYRSNDPIFRDANTSLEDFKKLYDKDSIGIVVYHDERRDLALVRAQYPGQPLRLFSGPTEAMVGEEVLALGHPRDFGYYMTKGIISRVITNCSSYMDYGKSYDERVPEHAPLRCIQTDAAINPGNSGGPLLSADEKRVLGVNTTVRARKVGEETVIVFPGLATAIHYDEVRMFLREAGVLDP